MNKKLLVLSAAVVAAAGARAQTAPQTATGIGTIAPNSSTILDVFSSNKGVLFPRVTLQSVTDATTIAAPATGLVVYNTNTALPAGMGLYYNAGTPTAPLWSRMVAMSAASAPVTGQTIIWNGTTYVSGNPAIAVAPGTPLSGNGTGSTPLTINVNAAVYNAANIQGSAVSSNIPTNGQVLVFNSTTNKYEPAMAAGDNWGTQVAATTGAAIVGNGTTANPLMVNNTLPLFNANKINNSTVSNTTPTNGQTLVYDAATATYVPGNQGITTIGNTFTGNGTPGSPLGFNGVAVTTPVTGNGTTNSPLSVNSTLPIFNANNLQGKAISTTAPTNGQVLIYNSTTNQYTPAAVPGDNWGTQTTATTGAAISGNGTATTPLMVNNTLPLFNANQLNSTTLTGTPTTNGQAIIFNGTNYVPGTPSVNAGSGISGNGTSTNPLIFSGINTTGSPLSGNGTSGSPLSINTASPVYNANTIQGSTVSTTTPTTNQVLVFNGTSYVPGAVNAVQIQGKTVSNTAPTNGQVLIYNSTTNQYVPSAVPGDNWGTQTAATTGAAISGNGTTTTPLMVNNTLPLFNANQLNNTAITGTPTTGQSIVYNGTSYAPGNPAVSAGNGITGNGTSSNPLAFSGISTTGAPLSGNGTSTSPLSINTASPVYNASTIQGKTVNNTAPTNGQVLIYNSTTNQYVPGIVPGDNWGTQTVNTTGQALSGNGTTTTPLTVNNNLAIFNANTIQGKAVSTTAPTTNQVLVYNGTSYVPGAVNATQIQGDNVSTVNPTNGQTLVFNTTTNQYTPTTVVSSASNGLNVSGTDVRLGGALTQNTTITTGTSKTLSFAGTSNTTTIDAAGNIGIGTTSPSSALTINATNPLKLTGLQNGYGNVLVVDNNGVVKQIPASATTFNYSACSISGVHISSSQLTGAVPYTQGSGPNGSIPGGGSWTMVPGLTKTISIANPNNTVYFNTEGVATYDGTIGTSSVTSYSIGIFIDGQLQATRSYTMVGSGSAGQFDTYNIAGQIEDLPAGNHTFQVYVTRRMQNGASNDLYFDGPSTVGNTNAFMTRGVLFISGTY